MLYRALLLTLATAHAWNECAFPDVGYYAVDEGLGLSFAYGAAGMNGELPQPRGLRRQWRLLLVHVSKAPLAYGNMATLAFGCSVLMHDRAAPSLELKFV